MCPCESNKKYKKCCLKNGINYNNGDVMKSLQKISMGTIQPTNVGEDVLFVPSYKTLPNSIVEEIENVVRNDGVIELGCWFNSFNLSLKVEGIESIQGWYGWKLKGKNLNLFLEMMDDESKRNSFKKGKWFMIDGEKTRVTLLEDGKTISMTDEMKTDSRNCIIDLKTGIEWSRHSWNIYNGVHFDITREFQQDIPPFSSNSKKVWTSYRSVKTVDTSVFKENQLVNELWDMTYQQSQGSRLLDVSGSL